MKEWKVAKIDLNKLLPMPRGTKLSPEERQRLDAEWEQRERVRPCYEQTNETIKPWLKKHVTPGLVVVVRSTMSTGARDYEYVLDEVTKVHTRSFNTRSTHAWNSAAYGHGRFYFSGGSADTPTGQVDLLVPTPAVVRAAINQKDQRILNRFLHKTLIERAIEQTRRLFGEDVRA